MSSLLQEAPSYPALCLSLSLQEASLSLGGLVDHSAKQEHNSHEKKKNQNHTYKPLIIHTVCVSQLRTTKMGAIEKPPERKDC